MISRTPRTRGIDLENRDSGSFLAEAPIEFVMNGQQVREGIEVLA